MSTTQKRRTITLSDRPPVKITDDDWPVIAWATGDSYGDGDCARRSQALLQGECDRYALRVRRHADGRAIVYAIVDAAASAWHEPAGGHDWRGGELVDAGADLAAVIRRVGESGGIPDHVIREAIADLPAEEL